MKLHKGIVLCLFPFLVWAMIGCASFGKFTPSGATQATGVIDFATATLKTLDGIYDQLLAFKVLGLPDYTIPATLALTLADSAAEMLKAMIAKNTATEEELNTARAKVEAAQLFLLKMQKGNK